MAAVKKNFADILSSLEGARDIKLREKLPSWAEAFSRQEAHCAGVNGIPKLSLEQCSSEPAALYKASVLERLMQGRKGHLCDLCCGLGADSWAFSRVCASVDAFEADSALSERTAANLAALGADNVTVRNACSESGMELGHYDVIYADPARRDHSGKKVFLLQDCSPNIPDMMPLLRDRASLLFFKLSPMADISSVAKALGQGLREVHVVACGSEVKELLCIMDTSYSGDFSINVCNLSFSAEPLFSFRAEEESESEVRYALAQKGMILCESRPELLKSGAYRLPCSIWGLKKLSVQAHLYVREQGSASPPELFKQYLIEDVLPFSKESFRTVGREWSDASISCRGLPVKSEELRRKLGLRSGGSSERHIFAYPGTEGRTMALCTKIDTNQ